MTTPSAQQTSTKLSHPILYGVLAGVAGTAITPFFIWLEFLNGMVVTDLYNLTVSDALFVIAAIPILLCCFLIPVIGALIYMRSRYHSFRGLRELGLGEFILGTIVVLIPLLFITPYVLVIAAVITSSLSCVGPSC